MADGKRVAVIGSGITGLGAAWLLARSGARVTLFEKEAQCGGHTLTDHTSPYPVDLGFQVYNLTTYPHLVGFLDSLGVDSEPSDMSFALSIDDGKLEWASHNLSTVFAQRRNMLSPSFLRMLWDVVRFGREAPKVLHPGKVQLYRGMSMGTYLQREGYSQPFIQHYLLPMCAAVWSVPNAQVLTFPVQMLVRFWVNHHLLDLTQRPLWRVVKGRSKSYVDKVLAALPDVRTSTPVLSVSRSLGGSDNGCGGADGAGSVTVTTAQGGAEEFDAVVFATHSDITLQLLGGDAEADERRILGAIPYNENDVYLHTDVSLMPADRYVWASWNFIGRSSDADTTAVCCSYWVNNLQSLPASAPDMFVTLNPPTPPAKDKTIRQLKLAHPVFSAASWQAQDLLPSIQGRRGAYYAGAWAGYGFHEDGLKAAIAAVQPLGVTIPWVPRSTSPKITLTQQCFFSAFHKFASVSIRTGYLRIILPNGAEVAYGSVETATEPCAPGQEWRGRPPLRATMRVFTYDFFRKVVLRHDTGLGEAYMEHMFEVDNLGALMAVVTANAVSAEDHRGALGLFNWVGDRLLYFQHKTRGNTVSGSRKNIEGHYDSGNAMYRLFLDESMTYSAGVHGLGDSLYQAQLNKMDTIITKAALCADDSVLEIGCGWGGFAIRAVQTTGCRVTGVTLSKEQLAEAQARVRAAGLEDRITLMFCDYRDCPGAGTFDKVVSIEMIEAVGQEHLHTYFQAIGHFLKPGGRAVIQAICTADERYEAYCRTSDFIRAHIFPGGHLPSMGAMIEAARGTGLSAHDVSDIGPDYAITLREWRRRWEANEKEIRNLGYSDAFWRKFRFYFAYCEAGFDARFIYDFHVVWLKDLQSKTDSLGATGATAYIITPAAGPADRAVMAEPGPPKDASKPPAPSTKHRTQQCLTQVGDARYHVMSTGIINNPDEMPNDPVLQGLVVLYIYLSCLIVRRHAVMWLMPLAALVASFANSLVHNVSLLSLPFYRNLNHELRAWWCADVVHVLFACVVSAAALVYVATTPHALLLTPADSASPLPAILCASVTGFFAFHLWICVRNRLFARTGQAIIQYTVLLVLFGVATYKKVCLPFLSVTLISEISTVFFLLGKLRHLAGYLSHNQLLSGAEVATLLACRLAFHGYVTVLVAGSPTAFSHPVYYALATLGMVYCNYMNLHRSNSLHLKLASVSAVVVGAAVAASVLGSAAA